MNLIVDIGNSSVKVAVFNGERLMYRTRLTAPYSQTLRTIAAEWRVAHCAYASVGTLPREITATLAETDPRPLCVTGLTPTPLQMGYASPQTLGADRLAAAVGAAHLHPHTPLLIIDVGTCITLDRVTAAGVYLGGNISPGIGMRLRALHAQTARLPLVTSDGDLREWGTDTETAIRAGAIRGADLEVQGYISRFLSDQPDGRVFLTGGNAYRLARHTAAERCEALVEIGLNRILEHQKACPRGSEA